MLSVTPETVPKGEEVEGIEELGSGGFGTIYKVTSTGGKKSVIKVVNKSYPLNDYGYSPQEILLSCSYRHPNLARGIGVEKAERIHPAFRNRGLAIALKLYDGGLDNYINKKRAEGKNNVAKIVLDIIHGYKAIRELGWIHLDIKPQNMLVSYDPFNLVIADFGTCRPVVRSYDSRQGVATGTPFFMPPETKDAKGDMKFLIDYDEKFDMYSLGVTFGLIYQAWPQFFERDSLKLFTARALSGLTKSKDQRWSLSDLLQSDFYAYLARLEPNRKYVSPRPTISEFKATDPSPEMEALLKQEIDRLANRAKSARGAIQQTLFKHISVEIISRARQYLVGTQDARGADRIGLVRAALRTAYKLIQTAELKTSDFFGEPSDGIIKYEEELLLARYKNMEANSSFDYVGDLEEFSKSLTGPVSLTLSPSPLLSTNAGGKDVSIATLVS